MLCPRGEGRGRHDTGSDGTGGERWGPGVSPMNWDGIDRALDRVRGESDRISLNLSELDRHVGYRLLKGADLIGLTRRRWEHASAHIHDLVQVYGAFRAVVDRAHRMHESGRGGPAEQAALTELLDGESVQLPAEEVPFHERGLLDEQQTQEHITPAAAVARMAAAYEEATDLIAAAQTAWDTLHPRLGELDALWQEIGTLTETVGSDPAAGEEEDAHERLRAQLADVGETVRRDPLSLVEEGRVDTSALERLHVLLERTRGELRDAVRMRDSYTDSVNRLRSSVDELAGNLERGRQLRARVVTRISSPAAVEIPDPVPGLRDRIAGMESLRAQGRWRRLGAQLGEVERAVHQAADDARDRESNLTGLLDRRTELRGRLDAYRARAARMGLAEKEELVELHGRAHRELWTAPGDLRAATVALSSYLRVLQELSGPESPTNRTTPGTGASDGESDGGVIR